MPQRTFIKLVLFILILSAETKTSWSQRSDTLYYNSKWQICEKPFATYYRLGKIVIDTFWYYSGYVSDYYLTDSMEMEGTYSALGEKHGLFAFYFPDGKQKSIGNYVNNRMSGPWEYFYRNGNLRLRIDYVGDNKNFTVLEFRDSTGKVLLKEGNGTFEMFINIGFTTYRLEGEYENGQRAGSWKYYVFLRSDEKETMLTKETYEKGKFKKGYEYSFYSGILETYKTPRIDINLLEYSKLKTTEHFSKDPTTFRHIRDDQDLADFLIKKQAPSFDVEDTTFENSFSDVLVTLNTPTIIRYFNDPKKIYNGVVTLNLSDTGNIEEIEITGNLTEKEKEYMLFFFKKFKNIHDITIENVVIDAYHKIYFYSLIFADFIPKRYLEHLPESQFFFSPVPYEKLKELIKTKKKRKKK